MMTKSGKKGWFKSVLNNQQQLVENTQINEVVKDQFNEMEDSNLSDSLNGKQVFSKDSQDKLSLDVIVSVENLLNARQLLLHNNKDLEDQLNAANETISRLKYDIQQKEQLLIDKGKEISVLEGSLTNKQMSYDQLLEDYKDYQYTSKNDYEKVSIQLEKQLNKYNKLNEESKNSQFESMSKIKELEEKIRNLEVENQKLEEQCQEILTEKNELMKTINDFTERMSLSFTAKTTSKS